MLCMLKISKSWREKYNYYSTHRCIASTPALAQAEGITKPEPQYCAYVAVIPRNVAPRGEDKYIVLYISDLNRTKGNCLQL